MIRELCRCPSHLLSTALHLHHTQQQPQQQPQQQSIGSLSDYDDEDEGHNERG